MLNPNLKDILKNHLSRYSLVTATAKRAREIALENEENNSANGTQTEEEDKTESVIGTSVEGRDIVAYHYDNQVEISMIQAINGDEYVLDVTNYPALAEKDAMKRKLKRTDIFAEHTYTNRFLGAIILFANTLFGRITMLLVPTILIFYEKQIVNIINKVSKKRHHEKIEQEEQQQ